MASHAAFTPEQHLNTLAPTPDGKLWGVLHNRGASDLVQLDLDGWREVSRLKGVGTQAHGLVFWDKWLLTLDSQARRGGRLIGGLAAWLAAWLATHFAGTDRAPGQALPEAHTHPSARCCPAGRRPAARRPSDRREARALAGAARCVLPCWPPAGLSAAPAPHS